MTTEAVEIPSFLKELLPNYISRRHEDAKELELALKREDFEKIARIAHTIRGNAETFGFHGLNDLCRQLESSVIKKDKQELELIINKIKNSDHWK